MYFWYPYAVFRKLMGTYLDAFVAGVKESRVAFKQSQVMLLGEIPFDSVAKVGVFLNFGVYGP